MTSTDIARTDRAATALEQLLWSLIAAHELRIGEAVLLAFHIADHVNPLHTAPGSRAHN